MSIWKRAAISFCTAVTITGCGAESSKTTEAGNPTDRIAVFQADQSDVDQAKFEQADARARWEASEIDDYTIRVGYQTLGGVEITVADDEPVGEVTIEDGAGPWPESPRTVEQAFAEVEALLAAAEGNALPPDGDCAAAYFTIRWDENLGHPTYYDNLGPCDDGLGIEIAVEVDLSS